MMMMMMMMIGLVVVERLGVIDPDKLMEICNEDELIIHHVSD